jgi:hyaluronoglucosaminidase
MPYPQDGSAQTVRSAVLEADSQLVDFVWSLSPGADYNFAAPAADLAAAQAKIDSMRQLGVRQFALFLDDNTTGATVQQQATLMNAIDDYIRMTDPTTHLIVVGNQYFGTTPTAYTSALGTALHPDIEVMWTGNAVFAATMSASDFTALDTSFQRNLSVWDNWPRATGTLTGRSGDLPGAIAAYYSNPVVDESHANAPKPVSAYLQMLGPIADFAWNASAYAASSSYARWQPIFTAWQAADRPCPANACSANGPLYPGFTCAGNGAEIAYCDARDNDCVTTVACPGGCKAGAMRGTDVCP